MNILFIKDYYKIKNKFFKFLIYVRYNIKKKYFGKKKFVIDYENNYLKKMFIKDCKYKKMILLYCKFFVLFKLEKYFRNREIIKMIYCIIL